MAIDERARLQLFQKLEEKLGRDEADTLMGLLPSVGWAEVATKHDLAILKGDLEQLEIRLEAKFEAKLERALRHQLRGFIGFQFALTGAVIAAAKLL